MDSSSSSCLPLENHCHVINVTKRKREDEGEIEPVTQQQPEPNSEAESEPVTVTQQNSEPVGQQQQQQHPLSKTSLCSYFRRSEGLCSHGESCRYAHGESELRQRPDGTWDPTSSFHRALATAVNKEEEEEEGHATADIMMTEALEGDDSSSPALSKCLVNLPMKWTSDQLRTFLNQQGVIFRSAKKKKGMIVGFVTFETADQAKVTGQELDGKSIGNNRTLKVADVLARPFEKNNKAALMEKPSPLTDQSNVDEVNGENDEDGHSVPTDSALKVRSVRDAVTPLAHMSYTDQLEHKKNSLAQTLKKLTRNGRKACPKGVSLPDWILNSREIGGLPCRLEGIIESPIVDGYRNKCEFSVGYSLQGKPTVGFLLGNFREGVTAVEEPVHCPNVSRISRRYAAIFQEFLQHSCLPVWNRLNNTGFWRQLTVREGRSPANVGELETNTLEVLLIVQVCTTGSNAEQAKGELEHLTQAFLVGSTPESLPLPLPLTALVIQDHRGISNAAPSDVPMLYVLNNKEQGECRLQAANDAVEPRIHDYISKFRFSISPSAFFQVNTLAAEKLYSLAGDWASLGPDTLLFDICCGTGTIGLTLAHRVGMVVGVEMNASAVSDAQRNAELNCIKNCRFVCGKAEDVIGSLMKEYLSLPDKRDEICITSQNNDTEGDAADSESGPKDTSIIDQQNGCNLCPENESQMQEHCTSQGGSTQEQQFKNVVAIVDPPRVGLHPTVIKVLRTQSRLKRLVYISCNPESLVANAIELCTPSSLDKANDKNNRGWRNMSSAGLARHRAKSMPTSDPFKPIKAMAVDLFPHTPHCELVMLMER